jgi:hypothetical protein
MTIITNLISWPPSFTPVTAIVSGIHAGRDYQQKWCEAWPSSAAQRIGFPLYAEFNGDLQFFNREKICPIDGEIIFTFRLLFKAVNAFLTTMLLISIKTTLELRDK